MKRKLKLHRETVRNLENHEMQEAQGGIISGAIPCATLRCSGAVSCGGTCEATCFTCHRIC